jgi:hypothetical protein
LFIVFNTHLVTKYINRVVLQPAKEASCKQSTLFSNFAIKNVVLYNSLFTVAWRSHISTWCVNYEKNRKIMSVISGQLLREIKNLILVLVIVAKSLTTSTYTRGVHRIRLDVYNPTIG